jgi:3'-5' exoribonuclease
MWDYTPTGALLDKKNTFVEAPASVSWSGSPHKRMIHHISRSAIEWSLAASRETTLTTEMHEEVLHAILAHHGTRAWGSPVAPKSRIAWLVHLCDNISARMYDADTLDTVKEKPESN